MSSSRQLAAIMFTDIVGYTALMGNDEQKAFELLRRNREIQKPLIKHFNGTWIKELGDGVLASFHTVTDAVFCAAAIHRSCSTVEGLKLRIGIHLGEVIFENHDVFGDGVNIASRLQAMASVGSTWVSEAVYKNLVNKKEITSEFVKEEILKNVSEPVKVYEISVKEIPGYLPDDIKAYQGQNGSEKPVRKKTIYIAAVVLLAGLLIAYFLFFNKQTKQLAGSNAKAEKSIVVLYFNNMTGDPELEYLSDCITEEITTRLGKIKGLEVRSRTSALSYKGKPLNIKKIAEELNVSALVEGSVMKSGDIIKITAQLIDGKTDGHFWSDDFTKEFKNIFELQREVARAIAQKLEIEITPEASEKINEASTSNVEAYENFQKGYFFIYKKYFQTGQEEDFVKSKQYFEKAIQLDPNYAEAYAGLAEIYDELRNKNVKAFPDSLLVLKEQLARKALQLNPKSSYVNTAMAWALAHIPGDPKFDSMLFFLKQAYYLDPADALTNWNLSTMLSNLGLHSTAIPLSLQAVKADPLNSDNYLVLGNQYATLGKYKEAKESFLKSLELTNEKFHGEYVVLNWLVYLNEFDIVEKRLDSRPEYKFTKSYLYACKGEPEKIDPLVRNDISILLATNRNKVLKDVIKRLEVEIDKGNNSFDYNYDWLASSYYFDAYREDSDFKRVLAKAKKNQEAKLLKYGKIDIPD
jgi:TolB-like protein/class 3 adenylate cyclase